MQLSSVDIILKVGNNDTRKFVFGECFLENGGAPMRRKVVFGNFRYRECDNLALYLEKMARQVLKLQKI